MGGSRLWQPFDLIGELAEPRRDLRMLLASADFDHAVLVLAKLQLDLERAMPFALRNAHAV